MIILSKWRLDILVYIYGIGMLLGLNRSGVGVDLGYVF